MVRRVRTHILIALSLAVWSTTVLAQGCSSSSNDDPDEAQAPSVVATAFCSAMHDCCEAAKFAYNDAACTAQMQAHATDLWAPVDKVIANAYNGGAVAPCADAMKTLEAKCQTDKSILESDLQYGLSAGFACREVRNGIRSPGERCGSNLDCASTGSSYVSCEGGQTGFIACHRTTIGAKVGEACGKIQEYERVLCTEGLYCELEVGSAGTCKPFKQPGESCAGIGSVGCGPASFCHSTGAQATCELRHSIGQPCSVSLECRSDEYCGDSKCAPLPGEGETCAGGYCADGFYCDQSANKCAPRKDDGAPCDLFHGGNDCKSSYCYYANIDATGPTVCYANNADLLISAQACSRGPYGP